MLKPKELMKFKFDCLNNRLWSLDGEYAYETLEENVFTTPYGEQGFILDSEQPNHWITFALYGQNIRIFYKMVNRVNGNEEVIYYQKDIPRKEIIEFELTKDDIIAKRDGKWVKQKPTKFNFPE